MISPTASTSPWRRLYDRLFGTPQQRGYRAAARGKLVKAAAIWHAAAQAGDADCQLALAEALWRGQGVLYDPAAALRWYERAGLAGRAPAQARLAGAYSVGIGNMAGRSGAPAPAISRDRAKARHWAAQAAAQGHMEAQVLLAWLLSSDEDEAVCDTTQAIDWYGRAIDQGSIPALVGLAGLIGAGDVPGQGPEDAFQLYKRAAEKENKAAFYHVGICLLQGTGVAPDPKEARRWLLRAADEGVIGAMRVLGHIHLRGVGGEPVDMAQAETWLRRAAVKGDSESMVLLGDLHASGKATIANPAEAILWYVTASEAGHARATTALGKAHLAGKDVLMDPARAAACFEQAAEKDVEARFQLGLCHLLGQGVPVDQGLAARHLLKAAAQQHPDATYNYGTLLYHGLGVSQDRQAALCFYKAAADLGSASGQFRMAHAHTLGQEVPEDPARAIDLFTAAAEQDHVAAQINLVRMLLKHRPEDRAALEKWRGRLQAPAQEGMTEAVTVLAELKWRLDGDAEGALDLLRRFVPAEDPMARYIREMIREAASGTVAAGGVIAGTPAADGVQRGAHGAD